MWEFYVAIAKARERKGLGNESLQKNVSSQFSAGSEEHTNKALSFANAFLQSTGMATTSKKVYIRGEQVIYTSYLNCTTDKLTRSHAIGIRTYFGLLSSFTLVLQKKHMVVRNQ